MLAVNDVADVLGLPAKETSARSPFGLISRIEHGLPIAALERVAHLLAPGDAQFKYRLVPKATYERRRSRASPFLGRGNTIGPRRAHLGPCARRLAERRRRARFLVSAASDDRGQATDRRGYQERIRRRDGCRYSRPPEVRQCCVTAQILIARYRPFVSAIQTALTRFSMQRARPSRQGDGTRPAAR